MGHTHCAPSRTSRISLRARRDHCSRCQSPLYTRHGQQPIHNRRKQGHTSKFLRRCTDRNVTKPQVGVVVGQRDTTGGPLARRLDATSKGVWLAGIPFICSYASLNLPIKEESAELLMHCNTVNNEELTRSSSDSGSHIVKDWRREGQHAWRWEWRCHET